MNDSLQHHGILGQKWGVRRYQNADGSLTAAVTYLATKGKTVSTRYGNLPVGTIAPAAVTLGGATVGAILGAKNSHTNKRLRAYYGHHS